MENNSSPIYVKVDLSNKKKYDIHIYMDIILEQHCGFHVLRDDLLEGGTKSILANFIIQQHIDKDQFVYASPAVGGFQVALSIYCKLYNKQAIIFSAKRRSPHRHTLLCKDLGAIIADVSPGYLSVVQHRAKQFCYGNDQAHYIDFGAYSDIHIDLLSNRCEMVIDKLGYEPDEIWCAVGSGTLLSSILKATKTAHIYGVVVGADCHIVDPRVILIKYDKPFDYESKFPTPFPSNANYDRKAFETLMKYRNGYDRSILFWNVMG